MADFYYRYNNGGDTLLLNDAFMGQSIPVTSGLHRRFMAQNFEANVWKDAVTGTTVTSANMTSVSHAIGDKQYRLMNAVQFSTIGTVEFGNTQLNAYTLFTITRYTGGTKRRIIDGKPENYFSGHHGNKAGVAHHGSWITPQADIHGNNFFIGTSIATQYFTNGTVRGTTASPGITYMPTLAINKGAYGFQGTYSEESDGQCLEVIMYDRQLTESERKKVEHYLASYYGILDKAGSIAAYYNRAPTASETNLLVSTRASPNWIVYPSFSIRKTGLTFAMWFKTSIPSGFVSDDTTWSRLIDFGIGSGTSGTSTHNIAICLYASNIRIGITNASTTTDNCILSNVYSSVNDGVWRHLIWTISADGLTWKIYINKVLQATITSANYINYSNSGSRAPFHPDETVIRTVNYIGKSTYSADPALNGSIEDFQMYNYPLDQTAINQTWSMYDTVSSHANRSLIPKYARPPLTTETSLLVSTTANPNYIIYPAFSIAQTGLTFSMWFKADTSDSYSRLFDFGNKSESDNIICFIYGSNLGVALFSGDNLATNNQFQLMNVFPSCNDNVWRHLVWTISADGLTWKVYINKVLQSTITSANAATYTLNGLVSAPSHPRSVLRASNYIGKSNWSGDKMFNGSIHAFQVWNYEVYPSVINTLYTETAFAGTYTLRDFPSMERPLGLGIFTLKSPTSTGSGEFLYTSSNTAVATITDNVVTMKSVGTTTITATQWTTSITATLTVVSKSTPIFGMFTVPTAAVGYVPFTLVPPTSTSTGAFTYTSSDTTVATVSGTTVTVLKVGKTLLTASQAADANYNASSINAEFVVTSTLPDFYYRTGSSLLLNEAYTVNPVPNGIHRRFKASDYNPVTKIWTDSVNGNRVTASGNVTLVPHVGDKKNRSMKVVEFDTTGSVNFNNDSLPAYTLFYITRYSGAIRTRILDAVGTNFAVGHWGGYAGVHFHNKWLTNPNPQFNATPAMNLHGTNFFVGCAVSTEYYTNGVQRSNETNKTGMLSSLPPLTVNAGANSGEASQCQVIEVLMYNRVLSDTERKKVEHYLASLYGILDVSGNLTASYNRSPLSTETSLLVSSTASPNWIVYPAFTIAQTGLSFSMWLKCGTNANYTRVFDFGVGQESSNIIMFLHTNHLGFMIQDSLTKKNETRNVILDCNDNQWRHVVWTIGVNGTWKVYVNKVLEKTIDSSNYLTFPNASNSVPFHPQSILRTSNYIAKSNWTGESVNVFNGSIDEFQMFNYALDQTAISAIYTVNTNTSLSVNLDQGSLPVPIAGTSFLSSDPSVATVSGTTLTLLSSGVTTITSNLHLTQNPVQLTLTVLKKGIGFISGTKDILETIDRTSIQPLTLNTTQTCQTVSLSAKNLYAKQLQLTVDGNPRGDTTLTFGKTKPNLWVAVGSGTNTMAYSSDGIQWTGLGTSIFVQGRGLAYNGRMWVAGGDGTSPTHTLGYSYDGLTWTGLGTSVFSSGTYDFAWNGKLWVAVGIGTQHTIAYSYDGINWTGRGNTINSWATSVAWNGTMFVVVGNGTVNMMYSYDGIQWTANNSSLFTIGGCVRWNGYLWVLGGGGATSSTYIAYSYDGITWTSVTNSKTLINHTNGLLGLAWNGILWVGACGGIGCTNSLIYSYDGITWNGLGTSIFSNYPYSVTWNGQMFMACGNATTGTNSMAYSYDGLTWIGLGTSLFSTICYSAVNNVAYENSLTVRRRMMIAGGRGTNTLAYSYDGVTWIGLGKTVFSTECYGVAYNGTMWVAVGSGNTDFAYSYDGINWTANTAYNSLFGLDGICVAWNGTMWIAGGTPGTCSMAYSYDGKVWYAVDSASIVFTSKCFSIATNGKRWVATGSGANTLAYSDDGKTWNGLGNAIITTYGISVAYNGNMFVAGGSSGTNYLAYSYDGKTWVGLGTSVPKCHGIDTNGSMWVTTNDNIMGYSYDGKTWFQNTISFFTGGMSVVWNGSIWVATGLGSSTIAYSTDGIRWTPLGKNILTPDGTAIGSSLLSKYVSVEPTRLHVACGGGTNTLAYSYDGFQWVGLGTSIFSHQCYTVASNGSMWIAGGGSGTTNTMAYSYDGINWIGLGKTLFPDTCTIVAWNGTMWVAGGYVGTTGAHSLAYSYDGINWTGSGKVAFVYSCDGLAWNGTVWVAVGWTTGSHIAYSYDGKTWFKVTNAVFTGGGVCDSVVWSGTKFVASGGGGLTMNSADGITWAYGDTTSQRGEWIAYNGSIFIIVGGNSKVFHSSDGVTWTQKTNSLSSGTVRGIIWTGKMWLLFAEGTGQIPYSYDGIVWYSNPTSFSLTIGGTIGYLAPQGYTSSSENSIQVYQPIVACGAGANTLAYSMDGITWTGLGKGIFETGYTALYSGSMWVAGGKGVNTLAYSYDGINWTGLGNRVFADTALTLYYNKINNVWYAGGISTNTMAYSYDGIQWTTVAQGLITTGCYTISSNGTMWIAGGQGTNTMAYSYDGVNWVANYNSPFAEICYGIAWNGTVWVAVGNGGIAYSYDGLQWTRATSLITRGRSVVWNGSLFGVIGDPYNLIAFSTDGILWNSTAFPTVTPFSTATIETKSVIWTGDKWVIFAGSPAIRYSYDGRRWINSDSTVFTVANGGGAADGRVSDTLNLVTDNYYQSGYNTLTIAANQTS